MVVQFSQEVRITNVNERQFLYEHQTSLEYTSRPIFGQDLLQ